MAADITKKQSSFSGRYANAVSSLLVAVDALAELKTEYDGNGYAPDGTSPYKLTDAVVQAAVPHITAAQLQLAVGAVVSVEATVTSNRGYLEAMRA